MTGASKKRRIIKIAIIVTCSLAGLAVILFAAAYFLLHNYTKKINYVEINNDEIIYDESLIDYYNNENLNDDAEEQIDNEEGQNGGAEEQSGDAEGQSGGADEVNRENDAIDSDEKNNTITDGNDAEDKTNIDGIEDNANKEGVDTEDTAGSDSAKTNTDTSGNTIAQISPLTEDAVDINKSNEKDDFKVSDYKLDWNLPYKDWPVKKDKNVLNVLLIGSDTRNSKKRGNSDTMIIISVNKKTRKIIVTSLLRDSYVKIQGLKDNRLNIAYIVGGAKLLIQTIEDNYRIKIDKYVSVDFFAFMDIVDAIGGITIDISKKEMEQINSNIININKVQNKDNKTLDCLKDYGTVHLNGRQTLGYVRIRHIGTDFGRTERQRKVLEIIFNEAKRLNLVQMNGLLNKILPEVTTNFSESELIARIIELPEYLKYEFVSWSIPMKGAYKNKTVRKHMEVLVIDFEKNIKEFYRKVYNITN